MNHRRDQILSVPTVAHNRRAALLALAAATGLAALLLPGPSRAAYPERPVRLVVGLQAGASTDVLARLLAQKLGERLGQTFVVENKPGAATRLGMEVVSRANADGYTLGVANAVTINFPLMFDNFAFAPGRDFVPVAMLGRAPSYLAVRAGLPVKSGAEFSAYARAQSGKLSFGQGGSGSNPHIATLLLVRSLGVQAVEVPYKGNAPTAVALAGGEIDFALLDYASVRPMVERGAVRLLAVTEPRRASLTPEIPTSGELGFTHEIDGVTPWFMLVAPAGTPAAVVATLNRHVVELLKARDVQHALGLAGIEADAGTPEEALAFFERQRELAGRLAREAKLSFK